MLKSFIFGLLMVFTSAVYGQVYTSSDNTGGNSIGAVYVMSNEIMNKVLIYRLNSDGKLSYAPSISTNGTGDDKTNASYSYPLFSRRTIQVYANYLFVVNPGSNSLSMFTISTSDATVLTLVAVQSVTGHFPVSVAVNSMYACVLSIGYTGAIDCFTYNSSSLNKISLSNSDLNAYPNNSISLFNIWNSRTGEILFSADNLTLIVVTNEMSSLSQSKILFFWFNGSLVPSSNNTLNSSTAVPISVTLVGNNGLLITTSSGIKFVTYQLTNGAVSSPFLPSTYFPLLSFATSPTFSPAIGSYFAIGSGSGLVQINVNITGATTDPFTIVPYYSFLCNDGSSHDATILTANNTDYMFLLGSGGNFISSYQLQVGNSPTAYCYTVTQANTTTLGMVTGIAGYIQKTNTPSTASALTFSYMILVLISFHNYIYV